MHVTKLLHKLLEDTCCSIDKRLQRIVFAAADTLTRCKELSIFGLGRSLESPAKVKHNIKRIDRLFGNAALHKKGIVFYLGMAKLLLQGNKRPVIIVDWSGLTRCGAYHFLRASIAVGGRTLTLYDQAYPLKDYTKDKTHRQFLKTLQSLLPDDCCPIIISDAGFRNPWFKAVSDMGWDFIGRVRNKTQFCTENNKEWLPIKSLYEQATTTAVYYGKVLLARSSSLT